jgi:hypothetical protein
MIEIGIRVREGYPPPETGGPKKIYIMGGRNY